MKRFLLFSAAQVVSGGDELIATWRKDENSWIWLDLQDEPNDAEHDLLRASFDLDELHIAEAQRQRHPPSLRVEADYLFVLFKALNADSHDLNFSTMQLAIFCGKRFLVTRHSAASPYLERQWTSNAQSPEPGLRPETIVSRLTRRIADRYGAVLLDLEVRLDDIEETILETQNESQLQELVRYNTQLRGMRRIISYHLHVFDALRNNPMLLANEVVGDEISDSYTLMERFSSLAELYQNVITDLIEGYISLNGHKLNQIMKVLTVVTVMFAPLALLVGIYGMNFENMPELKSSNGYFILLTMMGLISAGLLVLFRRLKWL
jgi:magnesium transporter